MGTLSLREREEIHLTGAKGRRLGKGREGKFFSHQPCSEAPVPTEKRFISSSL